MLQEDLEQLRSRERTYVRTLANLPISQERTRPLVEQQLEETRAKLREAELNTAASSSVSASKGALGSAHEYALDISKRYENIANFYIDLSLKAPRSFVSARLTPAAAEILDLHSVVSHFPGYPPNDVPDETVELETFQELFYQFLKTQPRVALLGEPGSGKSTTLSRAAFEYASNFVRDNSQPVPLIIELWNVGSPDQFFAEIDKQHRRAFGSEYDSECRKVYLIDGLNETDPTVVRAVSDWLRDDPSLWAIVACRRADYVDRTLPLRRVTILPFSLGQIRTFLRRALIDNDDRERLFWGLAGKESLGLWKWFQSISPSPNAFDSFWYGDIGGYRIHETEKAGVRNLQENLRTRDELPGMLQVVRSPYLLTLALNEYCRNDSVPSSRAGLVSAFLSTMLEGAQRTGLGVFDDVQKLTDLCSPEVAAELLWHIAYEVTRAGFSTGFTRDWARDICADSNHPLDADRALARGIRGGILTAVVGTDGRSVRFSHQLIQEFCAAKQLLREIAKGLALEDLWPSPKWWEPSRWDEIAQFAAEMQSDSSNFIEWMSEVNPTLAYRCATAGGVVCSNFVLNKLLFPAPGARVCPIARSAAGRLHAVTGDHRTGVGLDARHLPDIDWVRIPSGEYLIGGEDALRPLGLHAPENSVFVDKDFYLARYPVTITQFEPFLKEAYSADQYWTLEGLAWRGDRVEPSLCDLITGMPKNQPVVHVSWYEAVAFSNWLNSKFGNAYWSIGLPTQYEWEVAARFPDGRRFPWGGDYIPGSANIDETAEDAPVGPYFLRSATAVGLYEAGRSALGIYDLCGNVFEWTSSAWRPGGDSIYSSGEQSAAHRGVRGGSWYNSVRFAPAAARDCLDPDLSVFDVGFRLVRRRADSRIVGVTSKELLTADGGVLRISFFGDRGVGKTETMKSISHIPPISVLKRDEQSAANIPTEYGRAFEEPYMIFFYSPESADGYSPEWFRANALADVQVLVVDGSIEAPEKVVSVAKSLIARGPLIIGINRMRKKIYNDALYFNIAREVPSALICQYDAVDRDSSKALVDMAVSVIR